MNKIWFNKWYNSVCLVMGQAGQVGICITVYEIPSKCSGKFYTFVLTVSQQLSRRIPMKLLIALWTIFEIIVLIANESLQKYLLLLLYIIQYRLNDMFFNIIPLDLWAVTSNKVITIILYLDTYHYQNTRPCTRVYQEPPFF